MRTEKIKKASRSTRGTARRLSPEELKLLGKQLAAASNEIEAARIKAQLTRGFYGGDSENRSEP